MRIIKRWLTKLGNTFFYCGVSKEEYNSVKKIAYAVNFGVWRRINSILTVIFAALSLYVFFSHSLYQALPMYIGLTAYFLTITIVFYLISENSIAGQLLIYLNIILIFCAGLALSLARPDLPGGTFLMTLVVLPMFMIDKPYYMTIVLVLASSIYVSHIWVVKPIRVVEIETVNVIIDTLLGIMATIFYNGFRVREFLLQKTIEHQRDTDNLTGLYNKSALIETVNEYLHKDVTGILMVMDLDHFKAINDTYGHNTGDEALRLFGHYLGTCFRHSDIKGRWGGDEFVVYLPGASTEKIAIKYMDDIISYVNKNIRFSQNPEYVVGLSVGIALQTEEDTSFDSLFERADEALYQSKQKGYNCYTIYKKR